MSGGGGFAERERLGASNFARTGEARRGRAGRLPRRPGPSERVRAPAQPRTGPPGPRRRGTAADLLPGGDGRRRRQRVLPDAALPGGAPAGDDRALVAAHRDAADRHRRDRSSTCAAPPRSPSRRVARSRSAAPTSSPTRRCWIGWRWRWASGRAEDPGPFDHALALGALAGAGDARRHQGGAPAGRGPDHCHRGRRSLGRRAVRDLAGAFDEALRRAFAEEEDLTDPQQAKSPKLRYWDLRRNPVRGGVMATEQQTAPLRRGGSPRRLRLPDGHRQPHRQDLRAADHRQHDPRPRPAPDQGRRGRIRDDVLRPGLHQHGLLPLLDHLHRRRRGDPRTPRLLDRAAMRALDLPRGRLPADLRRAADPAAARALGLRHHPPHLRPRGPQAALRGLPLRRPPDGHAARRGRRALDLLPATPSRPTTPKSATWRRSG